MSIVAVCDVNAENAQRAARCLGLPPSSCFSDVDEMLRAVRPDILGVATRTPGRVEILEKAIALGVRAIHCEKPLSQDLAEGSRILDLARRQRVLLSYGTLRRYMAPYRRAKALVDSGVIGELREVVVDHGYKELLLWSHPHSVDLLLFFAGTEIASVNSVCDFGGIAPEGGVLDCDPRVDFARIRFQTGILGLITSSPGMNVRVSGTKGAVHILGNGERVELHFCDGGPHYSSEVVEVPPAASGAATAFRELSDALTQGGEIAISLDEIEANQRCLWAIAWSGLQGGATVEFDDPQIDDLRISGRFGELTA